MEDRKDLLSKIMHVHHFHETFQIGNADNITLIDERDYTLRYNLIKEENEEYLDACKNGDIVEIADALGDQLYILLGTALRHGIMDKMEAVFLEIHRSNMSKLDSDGNPIFREDGKVLKSEHYFRPDIAQFFRD